MSRIIFAKVVLVACSTLVVHGAMAQGYSASMTAKDWLKVEQDKTAVAVFVDAAKVGTAQNLIISTPSGQTVFNGSLNSYRAAGVPFSTKNKAYSVVQFRLDPGKYSFTVKGATKTFSLEPGKLNVLNATDFLGNDTYLGGDPITLSKSLSVFVDEANQSGGEVGPYYLEPGLNPTSWVSTPPWPVPKPTTAPSGGGGPKIK